MRFCKINLKIYGNSHVFVSPLPLYVQWGAFQLCAKETEAAVLVNLILVRPIKNGRAVDIFFNIFRLARSIHWRLQYPVGELNISETQWLASLLVKVKVAKV